MITGIAHVNLTVPPGTLEQAAEFYGNTLGFTRIAVPVLQKDSLAWYILPILPSVFLVTSFHMFPLSTHPTLRLRPLPASLYFDRTSHAIDHRHYKRKKSV